MQNSGKVLKILRVFHEMSVKDVSAILKVSPGYVSDLENGKKDLSFNMIKKYAQLFDTKPSVIIGLVEQSVSKSFSAKLKSTILGGLMQALEKLAYENQIDLSDREKPFLEVK